MTFLIADSFTDSLSRLTGDEQKAAKTTAFDLQMDPSAPGLSFHKLDRAKDKRFWSVRVNQDIRLIVHRTETAMLLCYVDHHDRAYAWAERRKLETHPTTGAAQMIELRESVREVVVPNYVQAEPTVRAKSRPLAGIQDERLLAFGVPADWLADVRGADEDELLALAEHLPSEAMEAVLQLATGGVPEQRVVETPADPFVHPDAQRRFRVVTSVEELAQALDAPWDKWAVFLHPAQRELVEHNFNGPARVVGSAGTGKTVVAVHRAAHLARTNSDWRVLLTTFSDPLAHSIRINVKRLVAMEPRVAERLEVHALPTLAARMYQQQIGPLQRATSEQISSALRQAARNHPTVKASPAFLRSEWDDVIDARQLGSWEAYRDVARLGRRTRLPEARRAELWTIFDEARRNLDTQGLVTDAAMFQALANAEANRARPVFDAIVTDESQDLSIAQLRFLAAIGGARPNALFFTGDLAQRIFQQPFSWKALGVDVRGRAKTLRVNYRTSHQIRECADRLLGQVLADVDGMIDPKRGAVSVFNGVAPHVELFDNLFAEEKAVSDWLKDALADGVRPEEVALFVRSELEIPRAQAAIRRAGSSSHLMDIRLTSKPGSFNVATMHLAKGLEFRAVAVLACDDEVIPLQTRIEAVGDEGDLQEIYDTERHLLYVACTRARDALWVSGVRPASEFLADLAP